MNWMIIAIAGVAIAYLDRRHINSLSLSEAIVVYLGIGLSFLVTFFLILSVAR